MLEHLVQDLKYAMRGVRAKPGFATAVVLTIALGIGANAAMFGIVDRMLFRPPPFMTDPASVNRIYTSRTVRGQDSPGDVSQYANFADLTTFSHSFSSTAGFAIITRAVGTGEAAQEMFIGVVSASFWSFFDAAPRLGRYFTPAEDSTPQGAYVTVLSHGTWQTMYGGRRDVVGEKIQIGASTYRVIGVAPRGFVGVWPNTPPAFYIPITAHAATEARGFPWMKGKLWWRTYTWGWMKMMARRKPGVSVAQANADLTNAYHQSYRLQLAENPRSTPEALARPYAFAGSILPDRGPNQSPVSKVAAWIGGVALIVLLIACANVANLLLARALGRRREIALRLALGVGRARLLSQLLTESAVLAVLGGVSGLVIAQWAGTILRSTLLPKTEHSPALTDGRTWLFTGITVIVIALLTGLAPIWQARRVNLTGDLKSGAREGTYHRSRLRVTLLVLQAGLSVLLLVGAGLFVRSLNNVQSIRLGYDADRVLLVNLNMRGVTLDSAAASALRMRLFDAAKTTPAIEHVSFQRTVPFWGHSSTNLFVQGIDTVARLGSFEFNTVSSDYFATLGTRILRGRGLTDQDSPHSPRVMVVSEAMGKRIWPGQDPIGQCVRLNADTMPCTYVVGIAENIINRSMSDDPGYYYYMPIVQFSGLIQGGLFVRTRETAAHFTEIVRRRLQREMPGASYVTVTPLSEIVGGQKQSWKLGATMFAVFGGLALVLAAIGLYSVIAYNVQQRTHEMGVRIALGAQTADVVRIVVGDAIRMIAAGVALGGAAAFLSSRWVKPLLFDESPRDPAVFAFVVTLLMLVAIIASWLPALRASRVDPQAALRAE